MKYAGKALLIALGFGQLGPATGAAVAQERAAASCGEGQVAVADYGFTGLECNCTFSVFADGRRRWRFRSEPVVRGAEDGSPADGRVETGDVITAIDGMLITTREAGERFANVAPGDEVTFTVRRRGQISKIELVAGLGCERVREPREVPVDIEPVPRPSPPTRPERPPRPEVDVRVTPRAAIRALPGGWFGFGISCNCVIRRARGSESAVWEFNDPPEVYSVETGSPADRAGLRRGDTLLAIDGIELTSDEGGRRFGAVEPGQEVRFTYRRGGERRSVGVTAIARPLAVAEPMPPEAPEPAVVAEAVEKLRYAGTIGQVDVEVRGGSTVIVSVIERGKEIEIVTADSRVRLRLRQ